MRHTPLINDALYQAGWFACVREGWTVGTEGSYRVDREEAWPFGARDRGGMRPRSIGSNCHRTQGSEP